MGENDVEERYKEVKKNYGKEEKNKVKENDEINEEQG